MKKIALIVLLAAVPGLALAQHGDHGPTSPYAGQEDRDIKSLSAEDIAELRRGGGWGLAKAAELNGFPGPAHLLELKDQIGLTKDQVAAIRIVFERMRDDATKEGERLIAMERALEEQFRGRAVTDQSLRKALADVEQSRQALRYIHLAAHLATPPLLAEEQIRRYIELRGYDANPCVNVPAGHDAAMWKQHNGCK
ncbi:MAG: hypothetical protein A3G18_07140 [Rhodospirillales bacterium RIFCSPLOWO2_12_FULL_58_28]|nr:MAG: hypothetical protein A3H92_11750 [Rhodospirillales bacterium RIFCSPLOWO2_02_FULL_58_16]OHC78647.1 MAG: hypothetical protein A3G18_07140 [Rhodospirillales bacterium RIFCSPLOWO2_12_FULL_58_28]